MSTSGKVLLVEDNENDVELAIRALAKSGITKEIVVTTDGALALDYLYRRNHYAERTDSNPVLILLDLKMPKVDGLQVLASIRGDASLKRIPVILFTSSREQQDLNKAYDLGVNAYVVKPAHFGDYVKALATLGEFWLNINEAPL
jgi:CheY-like chemotaxis protein